MTWSINVNMVLICDRKYLNTFTQVMYLSTNSWVYSTWFQGGTFTTTISVFIIYKSTVIYTYVRTFIFDLLFAGNT